MSEHNKAFIRRWVGGGWGKGGGGGGGREECRGGGGGGRGGGTSRVSPFVGRRGSSRSSGSSARRSRKSRSSWRTPSPRATKSRRVAPCAVATAATRSGLRPRSGPSSSRG